MPRQVSGVRSTAPGCTRIRSRRLGSRLLANLGAPKNIAAASIAAHRASIAPANGSRLYGRMTKFCAQCGRVFEPQRKDALYCDSRCQGAAHRASNGVQLRSMKIKPSAEDLLQADVPRSLGRISRRLLPQIEPEVERLQEARERREQRPPRATKTQRRIKERLAMEEGLLETLPLTADEKARVKLLCAAERSAVDAHVDRQPFIGARNAILPKVKAQGRPQRHSAATRAAVRIAVLPRIPPSASPRSRAR